LSILAAPVALAQGNHNGRGRAGNNAHRRPNQIHRGPERALHLSPEDRQTFQKNAERWLRMNPQQQSALRERERVLQEQRRREAEAFLRDSGLRLENGARQQFEQRYLQERIRIERSLRQEVETKRQQELQQLRERLKSESQPRQLSPAPNLSASPRD
jgi:hypothetical protein